MIGFVLVDKPEGPTSHDVVAIARRRLGVKRVGHAGTLDPPASGLLVLGVGFATRLLSYVRDLPKTYEATGVLGVRTTTLDAAGEIVSQQAVDVSEPSLREALRRFEGAIEQTPPAVSAVKVAGQRAYKRAARGETVTIEPRSVVVHSLTLTSFDPPAFALRVVCSSGTYVRSLISDVGDRLGCGAHVSRLRRTAIGHLHVDDAVPPEAIDAAALIPIERTLSHLPVVRLAGEDSSRAGNGRAVPAAVRDGDVLVLGSERVIGVFRAAEGILRPVTVLGAG